MGVSFPRKRESPTMIFRSPIKAFGDDKIVSSRTISFDPVSKGEEVQCFMLQNSSRSYLLVTLRKGILDKLKTDISRA